MVMFDQLRTSEQLQGFQYQYLDFNQSKYGTGRFYARGSLIRQRRVHRHFLTNGLYSEIDIVASNPSIALTLVERLGYALPHLEMYLANREEFHAHIYSHRDERFWSQSTQDGNIYSPKLLVNSYLNGSRQIFRELVQTGPISEQLSGLLRDLKRAAHVINSEYSFVECDEQAHNVVGSRVSHVLLTVEAYLVSRLIEYLYYRDVIQKKGEYYDCGYAYDGLFLPHQVGRDPNEVAAMCSQYCQTMGFHRIKLKAKMMSPHVLNIPRLMEFPVMVPRLGTIVNRHKAVIKYPTGRGKTYRSIRYACYNFETVLIIVHRQTLALDLKKNYPQFSCYLETEDDCSRINADKQIICINSLHRLAATINKYKIVIVDEINSILRQIVSMKMNPISVKFFERILLKDELRVLCLDALVSFKEEEFLAKYGNFQFCVPHEIQVPRAKVTIIDNKKYLLTLAKQDALSGVKLWIAHSMGIEKMEGFLQSLNLPYLHVTKFTKDTVSVEDFRRYDIVAFSPCIDAGVDITFFEEGVRMQHFERGYGLFFTGTTTPQQAVQMLGRDRTCQDFRVCWYGTNTDTVFENRNEFKNYVKSRARLLQTYQLTTYVDNEFNVEVEEDFAFDVAYVSNQTSAECNSKNYGKNLKYYLAVNGWSINHPDLDEKEVDEGIKRAEIEGIRNEYRSIASAPVNHEFAYEDLSRAATHARLADSIARAFNFAASGPVPEEYETKEAYITARQQQRLDLLDCLNEEGDAISFDYIKYYRENRLKLFAQRELIDIWAGLKPHPTFRFEILEPSYQEKIAMLNVIVRTMGFNNERLVIPKDRIRIDDNAFSKALKGKKMLTYIMDVAGLYVLTSDQTCELVSTIGNNDIEPCRFHIENSPFSCHELGEKRICETCFKEYRSNYSHRCRVPAGFYFQMVAGERLRFCLKCRQAVRRNAVRHRRRCANQ